MTPFTSDLFIMRLVNESYLKRESLLILLGGVFLLIKKKSILYLLDIVISDNDTYYVTTISHLGGSLPEEIQHTEIG